MYVTPAAVRQATGARPEDFGLPDDAALDELLARWAGYVKGLIDEHYTPPRDFLAEAGGNLDAVPASVRSVAERAMARWVQQARSHRDAVMIRLDEWRVGINLVDDVLPDTLRKDLPSPTARRVLGFVAHG